MNKKEELIMNMKENNISKENDKKETKQETVRRIQYQVSVSYCRNSDHSMSTTLFATDTDDSSITPCNNIVRAMNSVCADQGIFSGLYEGLFPSVVFNIILRTFEVTICKSALNDSILDIVELDPKFIIDTHQVYDDKFIGILTPDNFVLFRVGNNGEAIYLENRPVVFGVLNEMITYDVNPLINRDESTMKVSCEGGPLIEGGKIRILKDKRDLTKKTFQKNNVKEDDIND